MVGGGRWQPALVDLVKEVYEPCGLVQASSQKDVRQVVARILDVSVKDAYLSVQPKAVGLSLDCRRAQTKGGKVCNLIFAPGETPAYVRVRSTASPSGD